MTTPLVVAEPGYGHHTCNTFACGIQASDSHTRPAAAGAACLYDSQVFPTELLLEAASPTGNGIAML